MTAARSEPLDPQNVPERGDNERPVRIGISACLLGEAVRYDGGHKRDGFLVDTLGRFIEWVPVCPEVEAGFGTPREAMHLVRTNGGVRLLTVRTSVDVTGHLETAITRRMRTLPADDLSGYILKRGSPSCGLFRVKVYEPGGMPSTGGRGLFAAALAEQFPYLPIEEEGRLSDARLRENFVIRVFAYWRLRNLFAKGWSAAALMRFHSVHKLTLMAHSPRAVSSLGRVVADVRTLGRAETERHYAEGFMTALALIATRRRHTNVLQHIAGYFKRLLDDDSRQELATTIEDYRLGLVPLIVPITLIRHHVRAHRVSYLADQVYLSPHPKELMLLNHT
jgi:uncharacterized protein YbgA (DUF1722 family)/uncharacterized protein YbbK (DUF523 family)